MGCVLIIGKTGIVDNDPGTGSLHVFSISSSFLRMF